MAHVSLVQTTAHVSLVQKTVNVSLVQTTVHVSLVQTTVHVSIVQTTLRVSFVQTPVHVSLEIPKQTGRQKYNTCGTEILYSNALFWGLMQRSVVISYCCFGTNFLSYLQVSRIQKEACSKPRNVSNKLPLIAA